jgi:amino acid transporter
MARENISFAGLLVLGFFWVSGGIYGNEELLAEAATGLAFVMMLVVPLLVALPMALVSIDLSVAYPFDGGSVAWVEEAIKSVLIAPHNMVWFSLVYLIDAAIYPVFLAEYVGVHVDLEKAPGGWQNGISLIASAVLLLVTGIQLCGTSILVTWSTVMAFFSLFPTIIFLLAGLKRLRPREWIEFEYTTTNDEGDTVRGETNWSLLIR